MPPSLALASSQPPETVDGSAPYDYAADDPELTTLTVVGSSTSAWQFVIDLADWPTGDARKITLLQAVRLADGKRGAVIDQDALADRLQRSLDTVQQHLNVLKDEGWVTVSARRAPSGRWANEYRLGRSVRG